MIAGLLELLSGLWSPDPESHLTRDTRKRANRAYAAAWASRGRQDASDETPLLRELQSRNVPGSFSNSVADDSVLSFYFERWKAGESPKVVRAESAERRR